MLLTSVMPPLTWTGVERLVVVPSPSWPESFIPQAHTVPSFFTARLCATPAASAVTPTMPPLTWTGVERLVVVPSPSCPSSLAPQAQTVPSFFRARPWPVPATIAATSVRPLTWTGLVRLVVVPSPSWPASLTPQAHTVPSFFRATLNWSPAATARTPPGTLVSPLTRTGALRLIVVSSPSWPTALPPQAQTVPSPVTARLWSPPTAAFVTPLRPVTWTGTLLMANAVVSLPSWPEVLSPQAHRVPSFFRARLCRQRAAIPATSARPVVCAVAPGGCAACSPAGTPTPSAAIRMARNPETQARETIVQAR